MYNKDEVIAKAAIKANEVKDGELVVPINSVYLLVDAAYKAGEEAMYLAGRKACKKVYQNHKEDHLCRFNDGEQNCNCYLSGINEVIIALEELK